MTEVMIGSADWQDQIEQFSREGFLPRLRFHTNEELQGGRNAFESICEHRNTRELQRGYLLHDRHIWMDSVWAIATAPQLLDFVAKLIGPDVVLLGSRFVCKWPHDGTWVPWHQDSVKSGLLPNQQVVVWFAVDAAYVDNGCLRALPGSHRAGVLSHENAGFSAEWLVPRELAGSAHNPTDGYAIELAAGECAIFDSHLIHSSFPNLSDDRRCGFIIRYTSASVRPTMSGQWAALVVRGHDSAGSFGGLTREKAREFKYSAISS